MTRGRFDGLDKIKMKRVAIRLAVASLTFIIGVAAAMNWLSYTKPPAPNKQTPEVSFAASYASTLSKDDRGPESLRVCLRSLDIRLGDSFERVHSLVEITPDPNGLHQNGERQKGRQTDYFSTSGPELKLDEHHSLRSAIFCSFDDQQRLQSLLIYWIYDGEKSERVKRRINEVLKREHECPRGRLALAGRGPCLTSADSGKVIQELKSDFSCAVYGFWVIEYSIKSQ